ncbi:MAG: Rieske 2Fe-2S domain-containing protein [Pirellulales bacterium]|jgi:nitrite reductase/ring-hydroxylating ferredoxin subunit|nr:Rieske 2Fe-2S domain-containing protein [Pirellulales bacterium]HJN67058.1 Rieske 2Fe-2S domain-containing protein [Pirellulales bacterium]|tara:strand:+ start:815 stop:1123 length:309 start_codon:yes stop_codon:yes gene_type:complete
MSDWHELAKVADCPPNSSLERVIGDRVIALFNVDGTFHALDGICPHQCGPLGKGQLADCVVTCPWHGWQFDVRTGAYVLSDTVKQPHYDVRVEGETVLIRFS